MVALGLAGLAGHGHSLAVKAQHLALPGELTELPEYHVLREGHCKETAGELLEQILALPCNALRSNGAYVASRKASS